MAVLTNIFDFFGTGWFISRRSSILVDYLDPALFLKFRAKPVRQSGTVVNYVMLCWIIFAIGDKRIRAKSEQDSEGVDLYFFPERSQTRM